MSEGEETIDNRLMQCFLYWGPGNFANLYVRRLQSVYGMTYLAAKQLVVDEIKAGRIELTDDLRLYVAD